MDTDATILLVMAANREKGRDAYLDLRDDARFKVSSVTGGASPSFTITGDREDVKKIKGMLNERDGITLKEISSTLPAIQMRGTPLTRTRQFTEQATGAPA